MKEGIRIGYWDKTFAETLSYPAAAHGLLCAPVRTGKFRDVIAQILLSFKGSCFVIDPKGQAAAVTARYRKEVMGQDVCVLNPFNILPDYLKNIRHARYDPLTSQLDPASPSFAADAANLMDGLMPHGGAEVHWVDSARLLGGGEGMFLKEKCSRSSLPGLYQLIASEDIYTACEDAVKQSRNEFVVACLDRFAGIAAAQNREIRSVVSTAITRLGFMGNKPIADSMSESTLDFREMKKRPMTVYLILPGRYLASSAPWFRTIANSFADACLEEGQGDVPVLGILDEFKSAVGKLGSVETLLGMGAGYGCQLLTVIRDLPELKELYPQSWESWLSNAGFQIFFRPRDWTTSEYISRMAGMTEVHSTSRSFAAQKITLSSGSQGRRYLLPEEVRELPGDESLVFVEGVPGVIRAGRRPYDQSPEFAGRYDEDPYHAAKKKR